MKTNLALLNVSHIELKIYGKVHINTAGVEAVMSSFPTKLNED